LIDKLPDILDESKKNKRISNLLSDMSKNDKAINNIGSRTRFVWILEKN